jgi:CRISPR-associated protein Csm3
MLQLFGKVIVKGKIETKTGLRIGGTSGGLKIGGLDLNVITDQEDRPYIPGSSLKGKLRSLLEQKESHGNTNFYSGGKHECKEESNYNNCPVCKIWGTIAGRNFNVPTLTRLIVRDAYLITKDDQGNELDFWKRIRNNIELQWTEVKVETAIDRIKGSALDGSLRQIERVPAEAEFDWQLILNVFSDSDRDLLKKVFESLELLENDYLGGMGSRGYGQVELKDIELYWNNKAAYENGETKIDPSRKINNGYTTPNDLVKNFDTIKEKLL